MKMTISVYRNTRLTRDRFYRFDIRKDIEQGDFEVDPNDLIQVAIATVDAAGTDQALEQAYRLTNTTDIPWLWHQEIQLMLGDRKLANHQPKIADLINEIKAAGLDFHASDLYRSTEIGDIFNLANGEAYIVASCGFQPITLPGEEAK